MNKIFSISVCRILALVALVFASVAGLYGCSGTQLAPSSTFVLLDGSKQTTADLKGKVTLVNFWATSCVTCVAEMPKVIATYNKYKAQGYDTVAVAMSYDPPSYVVIKALPVNAHGLDGLLGSIHFLFRPVLLLVRAYLVTLRRKGIAYILP